MAEPAHFRPGAAAADLCARGFRRRRRQSRGAGLDRSLARLAGAGAGAGRPAGLRQDPSRPHLGGAGRGARRSTAPTSRARASPICTELAAASPTIVIDDADRAPERALFHLYNLMRERRGHLLLIATSAAGALVDRPARPRIAAARGARRGRGAARRRAAGLDHPEAARRSAIARRAPASCTIWSRTWSVRPKRRGASSPRSTGARWPSGARSTAAWRPMSWPSCPGRPERGRGGKMRKLVLVALLGVLASTASAQSVRR